MGFFTKMKENGELSDKEMEELARCYLDMDQENELDYLEKYDIYRQDSSKEDIPALAKEEEEDRDIDMERLIEDLKAFRWNTSQAERIRPYYIFNNNQMMDLIDKYPADLEQLKNVSGFGDVKIQKYGQEIIAILDKYR